MATSPLHAQSYSIDWHAIHSGGGTSAGGEFSVSGSVGSSNAATMREGGFSLEAGFWGGASGIPAPMAPLLTVGLDASSTIVISWLSTATGFTLQHSATLNPADWRTPSEAVTDNGTRRFISVPVSAGPRFYRLFKP